MLSREYPNFPLIGVGAVIVQNELVLLIRRGMEPAKGEWSIPGGLVNVGETLRDAAIREVLEETGLLIEPFQLVELVDRIFKDDLGRVRYHYVLADFLCHVRGGSLLAGSDAIEAKWFYRDELEELNLAEITLNVITKGMGPKLND